MGFKRPFDDEKFHELPFKHSRQLDYSDKSIHFEEFIPRHAVSQTSVATVNEGESFDGDTFDEESNFVYPGLDMDSFFIHVTKGCDGNDATHSPHSVNYFELAMPPRMSAPIESLYSFLLHQPARKQVPIGPGHQATIPEWEGSQNGNLEPLGMSGQNHMIGCPDGEKLSGTCVVPMPSLDTLAHMDDIIGKGRKFCVCQDRDSIRCVRQQIKEAREEIVKILGYEKFKDLGFCDMGEEVARNWSDEDAQLFHEVVYSNPVTLGRNFWQLLAAVFCSRTKKEIVSYYFNVFVLLRRATQNRRLILDIDSDDDEWHVCYGGSSVTHYVEEDEENSAIESSLHQRTEKVNEKVHPLDASNSYSDEDDDAYVDTRQGCTGQCEEYKTNPTVKYTDRYLGSNGERLNVEDDSCTSFEHAHGAVNSRWTNFAKKDETGPEEHQKKFKDCNDIVDSKAWVTTDGKDLQPTWSIMEEIMGHGSWENKARNK